MTGFRAIVPLLASLALCVACEGHDFPDAPEPPGGGGGEGGSGAAGGAVFVLAHGFGSSGDMAFSIDFANFVEGEGHRVFRPTVPAVGNIESRALALAPQIDEAIAATGADKVHIIAHSMGGLDSRFVISQLAYNDRIRSLTTVATPHQGTPLADTALGISGGNRGAALAAMASLFGTTTDDPGLREALMDLSTANAAAFNAANPDAADVHYTSFTGLATAGGFPNAAAAEACAAQGAAVPDPAVLNPILITAAPLLAEGTTGVPHDGVVQVASARHGEFLGCVASDHFFETTISGDPQAMARRAMYQSIIATVSQLP